MSLQNSLFVIASEYIKDFLHSEYPASCAFVSVLRAWWCGSQSQSVTESFTSRLKCVRDKCFLWKKYISICHSRETFGHILSAFPTMSVAFATKHAADFATDLAKRRRRGAIPQEIPPPGSAFFFRHRRTRHDCRIERQESEIVAKGSKKVIVRKVYVRWSLPDP